MRLLNKHEMIGAVALDDFAASANPGERLEYYRGDMAYDCSRYASKDDTTRDTLRELRETAYELATRQPPFLHLTQRKNGFVDFTYIATKPAPNLKALAGEKRRPK